VKTKILEISLVAVTVLSMSGCESSSNNTPPPSDEITTKSYNGAGSRWE